VRPLGDGAIARELRIERAARGLRRLDLVARRRSFGVTAPRRVDVPRRAHVVATVRRVRIGRGETAAASSKSAR
jgi:hypothetical protein